MILTIATNIMIVLVVLIIAASLVLPDVLKK